MPAVRPPGRGLGPFVIADGVEQVRGAAGFDRPVARLRDAAGENRRRRGDPIPRVCLFRGLAGSGLAGVATLQGDLLGILERQDRTAER